VANDSKSKKIPGEFLKFFSKLSMMMLNGDDDDG